MKSMSLNVNAGQNLRYGSQVRVFGKTSSGQKGIITSKGFFDHGTYFQTYENLSSINNYREGLFQILPSGSFEIHDEYLKGGEKNQGLFQRMKSEKEQYYHMIDDKMNEVIHFSSEVMFQHVESGQYLTCSTECSESRDDSFGLVLQQHLSSRQIFRIEPSKPYQQIGRPIISKQPVKIQSDMTKLWIDRNVQCSIPLDHRATQVNIKVDLRALEEDSHRFEMIVSHYQECTWKIKLVEYNEKQTVPRPAILKSYDVVTFKNSKKDSYLGVDVSKNMVVLKPIANSSQIPVECLWELQFQEKNQSEQPTIAVQQPRTLANFRQSIFYLNQNPTMNVIPPQYSPKVTNEQISVNKKKHQRQQLQLRHLMSGKVVGISKDQKEEIQYYYQAVLTSDPTFIILELANSYDKELVENVYVNLILNDDQLTILPQSTSVTESSKENSQMKSPNAHGSDSFFKSISKFYEGFRCGFRSRTYGESFVIQKVKSDYLKEIFQPFSAQEYLLYYLHILKHHPQNIKSLAKQGLTQRAQLLFQGLYEYLIDQSPETMSDENNLPIYTRQIILKELYFTEILVELLYSMCYKPGTKKLQIFQKDNEKLDTIFQLIYRLLTKLIQYNTVTKLYVSQWMEMFLHQYLVLHKPTIQAFLAEILDNNKEAIQKFLNQTTVQKIIEQITVQAPHEKYLKILKAICVSSNQPLRQYQALVLERFFEKISPNYRFELKLLNKKALIKFAENSSNFEWLELEKFYNYSLLNDNLQYWNYFISYFDLLSDAAFNRHEKAKVYIENNYPLETLCEILYEAQRNKRFNLMKPFLKLIRFAYVDAYPFKKINQLRIIKFKDLTHNYTDFLVKVPPDSPIQELMKFLSQQLKNQDEYQGNVDSSKTFHSILQLLKSTIEMGFWVQMDDIQLILENMYTICSSIKDFNASFNDENSQIFDSQEIYLQRKHHSTRLNEINNGKMLCKQLACEIIHSIFDLENNIRVFMCAKYFKDMLLRFELINSQLKNKLKLRNIIKKPFNNSDDKEQFIQKTQSQISDSEQFYDSKSWINLFQTIIKQRELTQNEFFELIFAELSFYENPLLPKYSLEILQRVYGQKKELIENFEKLIIVVSGKSNDLTNLGEICYEKLHIVKEDEFYELYQEKNTNLKTSLIWYHSNDHQKAGFMQNLFQLSHFLKKDFDKGRSLISLNFEDYAPNNRSIMVYCEREQNYRLHQSLAAALQIHHQLICFIQNFKEDLSSIYWKFLHASYNYLTLMIWNHQENKRIITSLKKQNQESKILIIHLKYNIGAVDFLKTLYSNNKDLLFSEKEILLFLNIIIPLCNGLKYNQFYKSKLLEFLNSLLIIDDNYITSNQTLILQKLQEKHNNVLIVIRLFVAQESPESPLTQSFSDLNSRTEFITEFEQELIITEDLFKELIQEYESSYEKINQGFHEVDISPELTYIYTFFAAMSQLIEEKHEINMKKCLRMHKFIDLVYLLELSQNCWPIKAHLRTYINRLYYGNLLEDVCELFLNVDLVTILDDLQKIIDYQISSKHTYMQMAIIKNPIRFKYFASYLYIYLQEILTTLNNIFLNDLFLGKFEEKLLHNQIEQIHSLHFQVLELCEKLSLIDKIYQNQNLGQQCQSLINIFYGFISGFDISILYIREGLFLSAMERMKFPRAIKGYTIEQTQVLKDVAKEVQKDRQIYKLLKSRLDEPKIQTYLISRVFSINEQFVKQNNQQNIIKFWKYQNKSQESEKLSINDLINHKLRRIMNNWQALPQFQQFLDEEFQEICHKLSQIGSESMVAYKKFFEVTTLQMYIQNIIQICAQTNEKQFSDEIIIFFLKMLHRLITEKNLSNKEKLVEVDTWTSDFWINYKNDIIEQQEKLIQCGAHNLILSLLSENLFEKNLQLLNECLLFAIALLLGGCKQAQQAILQYLKNDSMNIILTNIKTIISRLTKIVINNYSMSTQEEQQDEVINNPNNYDFYNIEKRIMQQVSINETDGSDFKILYSSTLSRIFRFLQLLCENNNSEMKDFLRVQTDEQNIQKINSINFIEFTCVQLRIYFKCLTRAFISIPDQIIDFINEIVQLPCKENQIDLCRTTFFEDVSNMAQYFSSRDNQMQKQFISYDDQQELQELQNKILQTVLLVLEGNDEKIFKDLENKLEVSFLLNFFHCNLQTLFIENVEDLQIFLKNQGRIFDQDLLRILNVCIIVKKMESFEQTRWVTLFKERIKQTKQLEGIFAILSNLVLDIEIVYEGKVMTIYFPSHPLFECLSEQTKQEFLYTVNRETQRDKLLEMLKATEMFYYELDHNYKLNHFKLPITSKSLDTMDKLSSILTILINVVMVKIYLSQIFFYKLVPKGQTYFLSSHLYASLSIKALSIVLLLVQAVFFFMDTFARIPIFLKKGNQDKNLFGIVFGAFQDDRLVLKFSLLILACFGTFFNSTFYVVHLVEIFSRVTILKNVFQAISYNAKQLLVVAFLGVLFVFAFSVLSFSIYFDDIYTEEQTETCDSLISCMITLITSGVIGNSMISWDPLKFFFDMVFTVFFGLLFTNIVQGIMIDTFAELRDQRQKIDEDIKNRCFICAAQRSELESKNKEFESHISKQHLIWNYIFYIKCLWLKQWTEYTGLEYWVIEKIQQEDISWFPEAVKDGKNVSERLDQLDSLLSQVLIYQENVAQE